MLTEGFGYGKMRKSGMALASQLCSRFRAVWKRRRNGLRRGRSFQRISLWRYMNGGKVRTIFVRKETAILGILRAQFMLAREVLMRVLILVLILILTGGLWRTAEAGSTVHVTLYPSGGRVQATEELTVSEGKIVFVLPDVASLDSLSVSLDAGNVLGWETMPVAGKESSEIAGLRMELKQARQQAAGLEGELAGIRSRIALWSNQSTADTPDMLDLLEKRMSERLPHLYGMQDACISRLQEARRNVERLERILEQKGESREAIRITARVSGASGKVLVHYAYNLANCGWQPVYRLDAHPATGAISFVQEAEIRQGSGQDWEHVDLTLNSGSPVDELEPLPLENWMLRPLRNLKRGVAGGVAASDMEAFNAPSAMLLSGAVPQQERATSSVWSLGIQSIPAGAAIRFPLEASLWKAHFVRLARPSSSPGAVFLMAEVLSSEKLVLPSGKASYMVDGVPVGTGSFSTNNWDGAVYFGTDPRVSVDMRLDVQKSGRQGFVDKRQTRVWTWKLSVASRHSMPVDVRIEDPAPQSADEAIRIQVSSSPEPERKDHVFVWNLTLPANGSETITHTVEASAPEDMKLNDGRQT